MPRRMKTDHLAVIDDRLDRLEARVDEGFAAVVRRFEQVDQRFEQMDKRFEQVDKRFDEQRSRFEALHEASQENFRNLYDLIKAQGEKTDARFEQMQADIRANTASVYAVLAHHERRLVVLERRTAKTGTRKR